MNKQFIIKLKLYFEDLDNKDKLFYIINNKLKKFKISKKKKFFIRYKYPHRKSESHYKSYVTIKKYLTKNKTWYTAKKKFLRFNNFEKTYLTNNMYNFTNYLELICNYSEN